MRGHSNTHTHTQTKHKNPILHLVCILVCFCLILFFIQSSYFTGSAKLDLSKRLEVDVLSQFQSSVQQCVANRGLGLTADIIDHCKLKLKYPE
ncbi:hypothetical protein KSS87_006821, partial [Heliosperma pusillum]